MDVILLKFDPEIRGTSAVAGYEGQIELLSIGHVALPAGGGNKAQQDVECTVIKNVDETSPHLNQAFHNATVFRTAEVTVLRGAGKELRPVLEYKMEHVMISSVAAAVREDAVIETVTLTYGVIQFVIAAEGDGSSDAKSASAKG